MVKLLKGFNKYWVIGIAILLLALASYWFFNKFFPTQSGEWLSENKDIFDKEAIPTGDWLISSTDGTNEKKNEFWTSMDFPGKQRACINVHYKDKNVEKGSLTVPIAQAPRASFYPRAGTIQNLFDKYSPAVIAESINQNKPFLLAHSHGNITREGKNIFFLSEGEKFLIPTRNIYGAFFPGKEFPSESKSESSVAYSNKIIGYPEGFLLSDGKGVFIISRRKTLLIRSPEIFESLGYRWEDITQMNNFEATLSSNQSNNLIDFNSAHSNGTILKEKESLFLVWNEELYELSDKEKTEYFPAKNPIEISKSNLQAECFSKTGKTECCLEETDPRMFPPQYFPFNNTILWNLDKLSDVSGIEKIDWQTEVIVNKENFIRRLGSFKNYIVYTLGIVK